MHVRFTAGVGVPETVAHLVERQGQGERPKARGCEDDELACFLQLEDYLSLPAPRTMQARPNSLRVAKPLKSDHKAETRLVVVPQVELAKGMLAKQHGIDAGMIAEVDFHKARTGYGKTVAPPSKFH